MPLPELFARLPEELVDAFDPEAPWSLLGAPLEAALNALPSEGIEGQISPDVHLAGDQIVIGKGSRVQPGALIEGPVRIGRDCLVRTGAYIRAGCWIGDGCVVGANTEIKHSILLDGSKAPHLAYVGDSILGAGVNLGAGTVLSNFRQDGVEILIPVDDARIASGRRKLGAILGDGVKTGCNAVLHPGVVLGRDSEVYPGVQLRSGIYPARTLIKLRQELVFVQRHERQEHHER
jgi:NDP-sugar pyrophosphorylase family protein